MSVQLKLKTLDAETICDVVGGEIKKFGGAIGSEKITSLTTASSEAEVGSIFCAIKGARVNGADFIPEALERGAVCVLTSEIPEAATLGGSAFCAIIVEDVIKAIGTLAGWYRDFSGAVFVAITGSVGKTTTKELIASVAAIKFKTHKTRGNYNNELGLPLTLLAIEPDDKVAVVELGMSARGEISYMSKLVKPDIAIVTNIGTAHLATLGTRENICKAKLEIRDGLRETGTLMINADEPLLMEGVTNTDGNIRLMSVYNRMGDYRALNIRTSNDGLIFDMIYDNKAVTNIEIPLLGKHNVYNALAAYAVGAMLGISDELIRRGLSSFVGAEMRQSIYDIGGGITVIDDCYNASPESMRAALDVLSSIALRKNLRPIALLGDMLELGEYSRLMHDHLGQYAAQCRIAKLFCYGMMSDVVAEAAIKKGIRAENVFVCLDTRDPQTMANMILDTASPGDILLVKASRAIHAELVIDCLKKKLTKMKNTKNDKQ